MAEDSAHVVRVQLAASGAAHLGTGWCSAVAASGNCGLVRKLRRAAHAAPPIAANSSSATHDGTCGGRSITGGLALVRRRWGPGHSKKAIALTVSKLSALHAVALESSARNRADTDHCGQVFRPVP